MTDNVYVDVGQDEELMGNDLDAIWGSLRSDENQYANTYGGSEADQRMAYYADPEAYDAGVRGLTSGIRQGEQDYLDWATENEVSAFDYRGDPNKLQAEKVFLNTDGLTKDQAMRLFQLQEPEMYSYLSSKGSWVDTKDGIRFEWDNPSFAEQYAMPLAELALNVGTGGLYNAAKGFITSATSGDLGGVLSSVAQGYVSLGVNEAKAALDAAEATGDAAAIASATQQLEEAKQLGAAVNAVESAATGDYVGALNSGLIASGQGSISSNLGDAISDANGNFLGLDASSLANAALKYGATGDINDAIVSYIQSGGGFGDILDQFGGDWQTPEFLKYFEQNYLRPAAKTAEEIGFWAANQVDDGLTYLDNLIDTPDEIKAIEDTLKEAGSTIDDEVIQPVLDVVENLVPNLNFGGLFDGMVSSSALSALGGVQPTQQQQQKEYSLFTNPYKRVMR